MAARADSIEPATRPAEPSAADGLRAVPVIVLILLLLDVVTSTIAQAYGVTGLGRTGPLPVLQGCLGAAAAAAVMWRRPRSAVLLTAVVVVLVFTGGATGHEVYLLVVVAVTAAVRADARQLALVLLAQGGFAVGLAFRQEARAPGLGWLVALQLLAIIVTAVVAGLTARRLLRTRDRWRSRIQQLERERTEIRAVERARLADELQDVVPRGLSRIDREIDAAAGSPGDLADLRRQLTRIDLHSRSLLGELQTLLGVLRPERPPRATPAWPPGRHGGSSRRGGLVPGRTTARFTGRSARVAAGVTLGVLAGWAAMDLRVPLDPEAAVRVLALSAGAVTLWRRLAGGCCAVAALVASAALGSPGYWNAPPVGLLCLLGALALGARRCWVVGLGLAGYATSLALADSDEQFVHVAAVCYLGFLGGLVGLAIRHFVQARQHSVGQLVELTEERDRMESEERGAVARELHDVVAHSLSIITMSVMATSGSEDRATLVETLAKVRRGSGAAHAELDTLLSAMRGAGSDEQPALVVAPLAGADALARQLAEHGYHPSLDIDPAAAALDLTTQRTLSRILQEATTNILRYAPEGASCEYRLAVEDGEVRLDIASPLAADRHRSDLSLGWGLRGIRERVDLTGGTFRAGADRGFWRVSVTLPAADRAAPPGAAVAGRQDADTRRRERSEVSA